MNKVSAYELGRVMGVARGQSINGAATPAELAAVELATLTMIEAVRAEAIGGQINNYEEHEELVRGVRDGQNHAMGRASKLGEAARA